MELRIGSTVWIFDRNHRVYPRNASGAAVGGPIYREHFRPHTIESETPRSWVLDGGLKVPKTGGDVREAGGGRYGKTIIYMSAEGVEDAIWRHENAYALGDHVRALTDVVVLKKVAALTGYVERCSAATRPEGSR
jgi:hypothetical protein